MSEGGVIVNYCQGALPIETVIELAKEDFEKVFLFSVYFIQFEPSDFQQPILCTKDHNLQDSRCFHVPEDEVLQTIEILDKNISRIANELEKETIRDDWKTTRQNYDRIDADNSIMYSNPVISAYSIGTTPIHIFLLQHLFRNTLSESIQTIDNLNIVCLCGGSGAELVSLVNTLKNPHIHITIVDKESQWKSTYFLRNHFTLDWILLLNHFTNNHNLLPMSLSLLIYCNSSITLLSRNDFSSLSDVIHTAHLVTMGRHFKVLIYFSVWNK